MSYSQSFLRGTPVVLNDQCNLKLDKQKSKNTPVWLNKMVLAAHNLRSQVTRQSLTPVREECNKYDLTTVPCFSFAIIMIGSGGLLLEISYLFAVPILVLWVGLEKKKKKIKRVIIMIGSGGLLLVISYLFAVPILVVWVGFGEKKGKKLNL
jgi:hypothetical protein